MPPKITRTNTTTFGAAPVQSKDRMDEKALRRESLFFCSVALALEVAVVVAFVALGFEYSVDIGTKRYVYFRDVGIMVFCGFGFRMAFLRRYGYSAIGYTLVISALVVQLSLVLERLVSKSDDWSSWPLTLESLTRGLFCAGAVMVSFGAVLGKVTPSQLLMMGSMEAVFYWVNVRLSMVEIGAHDVGGGMTVHLFGACFGLAAVWWFSGPDCHGHPDNASSYTSDVTSLLGTVLLWLLWPSFNAAFAGSDADQGRAIVNTFISLCACTIAFPIFSRLLAGHRFDPAWLQSASLAGGVAMGVSADLDVGVHGAAIAGFAAGAVSCLCYAKVTPLLSRFGIQDVSGVNNLHGMPGLISAVIGVVVAKTKGDLDASKQALAALATVGVGLVGGVATGAAMRCVGKALGTDLLRGDCFNDATFWNAAPGDVSVASGDSEGSTASLLKNQAGTASGTNFSGPPEHIFFYGTMKEGFHNHKRLSALFERNDAEFLKSPATAGVELLLFVDMYGVPYAGFPPHPTSGLQKRKAPGRVKGTLCKFEGGCVPSSMLASLDAFEGVPDRFQRRVIPIFVESADEPGQVITVQAFIYGIDATKVPDLLDTERYPLLEEYTLAFHKEVYKRRELRDPHFKQPWGGYIQAEEKDATV